MFIKTLIFVCSALSFASVVNGFICQNEGVFSNAGATDSFSLSRQFVICTKGNHGSYEQTNYECPKNYFFDDKSGSCVTTKAQVDGNFRKFMGSRKKRDIFTCPDEGKFTDSFGCTTYYYDCVQYDGVLRNIKVQCPPNSIYLNTLQNCLPINTFTTACGLSNENQMLSTSIGSTTVMTTDEPTNEYITSIVTEASPDTTESNSFSTETNVPSTTNTEEISIISTASSATAELSTSQLYQPSTTEVVHSSTEVEPHLIADRITTDNEVNTTDVSETESGNQTSDTDSMEAIPFTESHNQVSVTAESGTDMDLIESVTSEETSEIPSGVINEFSASPSSSSSSEELSTDDYQHSSNADFQSTTVSPTTPAIRVETESSSTTSPGLFSTTQYYPEESSTTYKYPIFTTEPATTEASIITEEMEFPDGMKSDKFSLWNFRVFNFFRNNTFFNTIFKND